MLILGAVYSLTSIATKNRKDYSILYSRVTINIILQSILILILNIKLSNLNKNISIFNGLLFDNILIDIFKIFIFIVSLIILFLTSFYPRHLKSEYEISNSKVSNLNESSKEFENKQIYNNKENKYWFVNRMSEQFRLLEYCLIILFTLIGVIFLLSNNDLVTLFLSIELQSYGLYLLCTLYKNSELSTSAGLTYFLLGALASCFILLGISLLYSNEGNFALDNIYIISNISRDTIDNIKYQYYKPFYIDMSLSILSIGLLFKISAAPFHFWSPEVYDNVPTIVTTFIALIPKLSILICLLELVHYTNKIVLDGNISWTSGLLLSSLLSLIIGTVLGLTQSRIKRLYAYSTISHLGFILLALTICTIESSQAFIFYLIQYTISNLNAFFLLICMGYFLSFYTVNNVEFNKIKEKNNSPIQLINQIQGYYNINPTLALSLSITLFSFAGVPPLIGFFGKQMVLSSALDKGYVFLVLVAILTSVIGAVYYLNIIKKMYFDKNEYNIYITNESKYIWDKITISSYLCIIISIITLLMLLFILFPKEFLNMTNILALVIYT
jgi:NADH-ubiquinone oxidoreductase chain 2